MATLFDLLDEYAVEPPPPANTVPPTITGSALVGETITCSQGTWDPAGDTYTYRWYRDGELIEGATTSTYELVEVDAGTIVACIVEATNDSGSDFAADDGTPGVGPIESLPLSLVAPTVGGSPAVGGTLTVNPGVWGGYPSPTWSAYQWLADGDPIPGESVNSYVVAELPGTVISCLVTYTNTNGDASAESDTATVVSANATVFSLLDEYAAAAPASGSGSGDPGPATYTFSLLDSYSAAAPVVETSITIRKHPTSGQLVAMPLLVKVGAILVDPVSGEPWEVP